MIRLGIIGANEAARRHLSCLSDVKEFSCSGIFDPDQPAAQKIADEFGINCHEGVQALFECSDAVDIQTPVGQHYKYASAAIMRSIHVMLSGLISEDIREARHLHELAIEAQVHIKVLHNDKLHPEVKTLKRITRKPVYVECNRFQNKVLSISNDSIIFGTLLSDIDLLSHLVNSRVRKVSTNATRIYNDFVDFVNVRIDFENGCTANINCGNFENGENSHIRIFQKNECIRIDLDSYAITKLIKTENGEFTQVPFNQSRTRPDAVVRIELQQFATHIHDKLRTTQDSYQAFESLRIAHQIIEKFHPSTLFDA